MQSIWRWRAADRTAKEKVHRRCAQSLFDGLTQRRRGSQAARQATGNVALPSPPSPRPHLAARVAGNRAGGWALRGLAAVRPRRPVTGGWASDAAAAPTPSFGQRRRRSSSPGRRLPHHPLRRQQQWPPRRGWPFEVGSCWWKDIPRLSILFCGINCTLHNWGWFHCSFLGQYLDGSYSIRTIPKAAFVCKEH